MTTIFNYSDESLFLSYEWLPTLENEDMDSSVKRAIECSKVIQPPFCSIPWRYPFPVTKDCNAIKFSIQLQNHGQVVMFHISCQGLTEDNARQTLSELKRNGIAYVFALRGDKRTEGHGRFPYAKDLVKFIRKEFGSYFKICVAGYPSGHPESISKANDLEFLKEKVDAGANFIISQIVFDASEFIQFVKDCRLAGIQIPIIPGILPFQDLEMIERVCENCCVTMPYHLKQKYLDLGDTQEEFEHLSLQTSVDIITAIISSEFKVPGIHIFTFNRPDIVLKIKNKLSGSTVFTKLKRM